MNFFKRLSTIGFLILTVYSIIILLIEYKTSQEYVRNFLTDIEGPVPFYAVNTTLSVMLLSFTSLLFLINTLVSDKGKKGGKKQLFYILQVFVFAYLAADDRFMIHEKMKHNIGLEGDIALIIVGFSEMLLLLFLGDFFKQPIKQKIYIVLAGIFFVIMLIADTFLDPEAVMRLSIEDLSKTWSVFFLFLFAWNILIMNIDSLKSRSNTV